MRRRAVSRTFATVACAAALALVAALVPTRAPSPATAAIPNRPAGTPYWPGWDIARDVVLVNNGNGGFVLDGFGGLHAFGRRGHGPPARPTGLPYWRGWDIARAVVFTGAARGYLLDGFGGVHRFGGAAPITTPLPYWSGIDVARDLVLRPGGQGGYLLDAQGGVFPFGIGGAPAPARPSGTPYWGYAIARDMDLLADGSGGWVLDGYAGIHRAGAPSVVPDSPVPYWLGWDIARSLALLPDRSGGFVLDGFGGLHPFSLGSGPPQLTVQTFLTGLARPWDLAFTPDGWVVYTERAFGVSAVRTNGSAWRRLLTPPDLFVGSEGGTLGLALDPSYATNRRVYVCYSSTANDVRLVRYVVAYSGGAPTGLTNATPIMTGAPRGSGRHNGCRPRFGPDGALWVGTGDAAMGSVPQNLSSLGGKVLRIDTNGAAAPGNPVTGGDPRIWSWGHRNTQGIAFAPGAPAWRGFSVEHGTDRDDEVNRLVSGNFGWDPVPGYDESRPMTDLGKFPSAVRAAWSSGFPTIAPSGATFLVGPQWRGWNGALATAVLKGAHLRVFFTQPDGTITGQVAALAHGVRLRSAVQGPDGNLYVTTDNRPGGDQIWRVIPG